MNAYGRRLFARALKRHEVTADLRRTIFGGKWIAFVKGVPVTKSCHLGRCLVYLPSKTSALRCGLAHALAAA